MTLAEMCILVACLLPFVCASLAKSGGLGASGRNGKFDNHHPRAWLENLEGWHARAHAAQLNSFEALPLFIAGVLVAQQHQAPQHLINALAAAFIVLRVAYIGMYVADKATLRSTVWGLGVLCSIALFFI